MITIPTRFDKLFNEDGTPTLRGAVWIEEITGAFNLEDWHEVGATGEPAFENSWVNYDSGANTLAAFYKDAFGIVHIKGLVKTGVPPSTVFTLPVGYRPTEAYNFAASGNSAYSNIAIDIDGTVDITTGSSIWNSINCSFRV